MYNFHFFIDVDLDSKVKKIIIDIFLSDFVLGEFFIVKFFLNLICKIFLLK